MGCRWVSGGWSAVPLFFHSSLSLYSTLFAAFFYYSNTKETERGGLSLSSAPADCAVFRHMYSAARYTGRQRIGSH